LRAKRLEAVKRHERPSVTVPRRATVEILPKTEFPVECDEVFYPGRTYWQWAACAANLLMVGALAYFNHAMPPSLRPYGAGAAVAFGAAAVVLVMNGRHCAVALTAEGVYYRNWRRAVWFIAWSDLEQVTVTRGIRWSGGRLRYVDFLHISGRTPARRRTTLKIAQVGITRMWVRFWPLPTIRPGPIGSALIDRAGLVPDQDSDDRRTWVRPAASVEAPPSSDMTAAVTHPTPTARSPSPQWHQTECKWCGEAFSAGTTRCPQCGRPVPPDGA
jgi:hypothetical protein